MPLLTEIETRQVDVILIDHESQANIREEIDNDVIKEYVRAMRGGETFPPCDLFTENETFFWCADGDHRLFAWEDAGETSVPAHVHRGGLEAAKLFACKSNSRHGLQRKNCDKRAAVLFVLSNPIRVSAWSNARVATHCGVSESLVKRIKQQMADSIRNPPLEDGASRLNGSEPPEGGEESDNTGNEGETGIERRVVRTQAARKGLRAVFAKFQRDTKWVGDNDGHSLQELIKPELKAIATKLKNVWIDAP